MARSVAARAEDVDAVVVGSGFGGSVAAFRLAEAGRRVVVLERGRAYPPGSFPRAPHEMARAFWDPSEGLYGLFDVWTFRGFSAVAASGLGGGSLIYANVLLRKDEKWFVTEPSDGARPWPVSRADLDPHYDEVEQMLGAQRFPLGQPGYGASGKTAALRDAAAELGLHWDLTPLAVTFGADGRTEPGLAIPDAPYGNLHGRLRTTCRLCGECDIGCNSGSKNTLDHTYLSAAAHHQADIRTRCEVRAFEPSDTGWAVHYVVHDPASEGSRTDTGSLPRRTVTCRQLFLAAGALGTPYLLLRNRAALPGLSRRLGRGFSGNGDLLGFVRNAEHDDGRARRLGSTAAPVITSAIRVPDALDGDGAAAGARGFYLEDAGYPGFADWLIEATDVPGLAHRAVRAGYDWAANRLRATPSSELDVWLSALIGSGNRSSGATALLGMGRDIPDGVMRLRGRWLDIDWSTRTSRTYFDRVRRTMADVAGELGGRFESNPLSWLDRVVTVHPLGGAPMGHTAADGVVDSHGEVFGHPGLFVVDGSVMPGPVGANPSLTIAAFANRAAQALLEGRTARPKRVTRGGTTGSRAATSRPVRPAPPVAAGAGRLEFTETMRGYVALDQQDSILGAEDAKVAGEPMTVRVTIRIPDVVGLVDDPRHETTATGHIDCDVLGGRLEVSDGTVNLLVDRPGKAAVGIDYRLLFADGVGHPLTLSGSREIHDHPGPDVLADTTTLAVRILAGHVTADDEAGARIVGAGLVSIRLPTLAGQLASVRVSGGPAGIATLLRFGAFSADRLWQVYRPTLTSTPKAR